MKRYLLVLSFLLCFLSSRAQSFYEIKWESDRPYVALMVYYDKSQVEVRVKYEDDQGVYRVAKYKAEGTIDIDKEEDETYFIFDGHNAEVVYSADGSESGYVADNFIFMSPNEDYVFQHLFVIDDYDIEREDIENYMAEATYRLVNPQTEFTQQFIFDYFDEHEPEYAKYLGLVKPQQPVDVPPATQPTTTAKPVLHLVVVADVEDRSIGKSTAQDQKDVTTTFTKISRELGVEIKDYQLSGTSFNKNDIMNNLGQIANGPNDIIVYYYSGHGYNDTQINSRFPTMALDGPDVNLEEVHNAINAKNARLTMVIGDMCNSLPENRRAVGSREAIPFRSGYLFDNNKLEKLFLQSSGTLISTSSQKGEWSFCMNNPDGTMGNGQFTHAFLESMIKEASMVSGSDAEWDDLFNRAYQAAHQSTQSITNQNGRKGQSGFNVININY